MIHTILYLKNKNKNNHYYNIFLEKGLYEDISKTIFLPYLSLLLKFQSYVCNRCHDLVMMSMGLSGIAILNFKGADYHCIINIWPKKVEHYKT